MPEKPKNNISNEAPCMICLSEAELNEIKEGKPMPSWKFLPWIMEYLGVPMRVKDPPPPEPDSETDPEWEEERKKQHATKKKKKAQAAAAAKKAEEEEAAAKAERANRRAAIRHEGGDPAEQGLPDSEEEKHVDDVPIDWLIL